MAAIKGVRQKLKTEVHKIVQRKRTHKNKIKKYTILMGKFPSDPHFSIWKEKLGHSKVKAAGG